MLYSYKIILFLLFYSTEILYGGTVKIQYSKNYVNDASVINSSPNFQSGDNEWGWITYYTSNNRIVRSYIKIPVPDFITSNMAVSVTSAELILYFGDLYNSYSPFSISIHRVKSSWEESSLSWSNQPSFDVTSEATSIQNSNQMWVSFPIMNLIKKWISGEQINYGVMLRAAVEESPTQNSANFRTSNYVDAAFRPVLEISSPDLPDTLITDVFGSPPSTEYYVDQYTIALWHLNEGIGITSMDSTNNHTDLTLHNGVDWTSGKFGSGILLDGTDDYLTAANDAIFNFGQGSSFTIEFWIKIISNDQLDDKCIFSKTDSSSGVGYGIWIDNQNFLRARVTDNSLIGQPLNGSQLSLNQWYNVVFIRGCSESGLKFYVDGILVADVIDPTYSLVNSIPFYIGRAGRNDNWNSTCINAIIDEIRISQIARTVTSIHQVYNLVPEQFSLEQNYPNPFNPITTIAYQISKQSKIILRVVDILGRELETLVSGEKNVGSYSVKFDGSKLPSGIYFYQLITNEKVITKKFVLLK